MKELWNLGGSLRSGPARLARLLCSVLLLIGCTANIEGAPGQAFGPANGAGVAPNANNALL
ncbi:MAG TPA: hypothetical protein VIW29_01775, partial [Polyangiaceae bacterium]